MKSKTSEGLFVTRWIGSALRGGWERTLRLFRGFKTASRLWKPRIRGVKVHRIFPYLLLFIILDVAMAWSFHAVAAQLGMFVIPSLREPLIGSVVWVGALAVTMGVLSVIAYALMELQAWLPLWLSLPLTIFSAVVTLLIVDFRLVAVQGAVHLYPPDSRDAYYRAVTALEPTAVWIITGGVFLLTVLSAYVQLRVVIGVLREGDAFTQGRFFKSWSEPVTPFPTLGSVLLHLISSRKSQDPAT